ncbi:haloacid dehalogenase type II [Amnibacterium sp. CER49]|uniref:haloacid dehalogenase type II n=1 Tax=Amnibacterium sp. CER49 TaxID=3039161 RepID=UPI00244D1836|nr:haloacid dehalogenase type II [Amnibacterium sp. CER49]MDH2444479.1 haloacid dehalogenase type II [Amnibacterium sp. CER49]
MEQPVIVFDVNETLSDLAPLAQRFADVGADPRTARIWFGEVLRDGFALTLAGTPVPFATLAAERARALLAGSDVDGGVEHVLEGLRGLAVHRDVVPGIAALSGAGFRLVTLTNGATATAERLLGDAGVLPAFERLLSVEETDAAGAWKPSPAAYRSAEHALGLPPERLLLVAVHPWDVHGAATAGWRTAWLDRRSEPYPVSMRQPDLRAAGLVGLAEQLTAGPPPGSGDQPAGA